MRIDFKFNLDIDDLISFRQDFPEAIIEVLQEVGAEAVQEVKQAAPVRTGRLKSEVVATVNPVDDSITIESPTPYASYQELGTSRRAARPYFFPSVEHAAAALEAKYNQRINKSR